MPDSFPTQDDESPERRFTPRVGPVDGRRGFLIDRDRELVVRVLNESIGGYRIATERTCYLPENSKTVFRLDNRSMRVRIVYKRLEGRRTMIGLQYLGGVTAPLLPAVEKRD